MRKRKGYRLYEIKRERERERKRARERERERKKRERESKREQNVVNGRESAVNIRLDGSNYPC